MSDLIDRQAAIDALDEWESIHSWNAWCYGHKDEAKKFHIAAPTAVIENLPSAQPEIVRCKDCIKRNRKLGSLDEHYNRYNKSQCCPMIEFRGMPQGHEFDYQYCSWAERRTDG